MPNFARAQAIWLAIIAVEELRARTPQSRRIKEETQHLLLEVMLEQLEAA